MVEINSPVISLIWIGKTGQNHLRLITLGCLGDLMKGELVELTSWRTLAIDDINNRQTHGLFLFTVPGIKVSQLYYISVYTANNDNNAYIDNKFLSITAIVLLPVRCVCEMQYTKHYILV